MDGKASLAVIFVGVLAATAPTRAAFVCVNPGGTSGCFASIQAAVNAAGYFDIVRIAAGTYAEKVVLPNNRKVTITGAGEEKTIIDGTSVGGTTAVISMSNNPTARFDLTVSDLTVRGGYRGIDTGRGNDVTLRRLVVRDNGIGSGAGVFNNSSDVLITDSIIRNNTANDAFFGCDGSGGAGGGIGKLCGGGTYTIVNTAVVNNTARAGGGAIFVNATETIINSTFSGNVATDPNGIGGAIEDFADELDISSTTIANNTTRAGGGALFVGSAVTNLIGSILDGNVGGNCLVGAPVSSLGYNVDSDASCGLTATGDISGVSARLFPLADNGGHTLTHALKGHSPAIDLVPTDLCGPPATDQRGHLRPAGKACDAGAFERKKGNDEDRHDDKDHDRK